MSVSAADIHRISVNQPEGNSVLIVHSDAPIAHQVIPEFFELVPRTLQIAQTGSSVEKVQFANCDRPNSTVDPSSRFGIRTVVNVLRCWIKQRT